MTSSPSSSSAGANGRTPADALADNPPAISSMWRLCKIGYQHEPRLLIASLGLALLAAAPDALYAVWLALLGKGAIDGDRTLIVVAAIGLGASATATWFLQIITTRVQRR